MSDSQWLLFPKYGPLVKAERNLEEFPLFELKARKRGTKGRKEDPYREAVVALSNQGCGKYLHA